MQAHAIADALSVEHARQTILDRVAPPGGYERVFVRQALGRVLATDAIAPVDVPAHDNAAMDGYAVRHADLAGESPTTLQVVGTALAGHPFAGTLGAGQAVRIMTGAIVPPGADTIVIQEIVRHVDDGDGNGDGTTRVSIPPGQRRNQNLRRAGEDLRAGEAALTAGKLLRPSEIGLLASLGQAEVTLYRRLRVAMFSTGDELNSIGNVLRPGEVYDSNRYSLWGMLTRLGCEVLDMGVVRDEPAALEAALRAAAANADAIVTSGGVSVGEADFVREMLIRLGEVTFWKIAMKPGRPMAFGRIGGHAGNGAWLFGLPGNPVAVMVAFYQFVRPALLKMMGVAPQWLAVPTLRVTCTVPLKKSPGRTEFQRGILAPENGAWQVRPAGAQGSGILRSMTDANCLIVIEAARGNVAAGESVDVQLMDGLV